uniref:Cytochrome P450 n=1 Tax=Croton stellatopilosus TaxID=431156 RepID=A0A3G2CK03_9ROSI|nr:cytochrome P450 [Croton stellatopilosus]
MKSFPYLEIALYTLLLAILPIFLIIKVKHTKNKTNEKKPPEPAGSWPIIGHLHILARSNQLLYRKFGSMAEELGPIFSINLGTQKAIVISNWKVAKECFTTHDKVFPTRPKSLAVRIMGYNHAMLGFAPYGQYWRDIRKLAAVELLSNSRLELLKHVMDTEIKFFINHLYQISVKNAEEHPVVEMKDKFAGLTLNIIVKMIAGKRFFDSNGVRDKDSRQFSKTLEGFSYFVGLFYFSDTIPFLGWLDSLRGSVGEMKRVAKEIDDVLAKWVKEHRENRLQGSMKEEDQDFIHVMLSSMDEGKSSVHEPDTIIKGTCLSLILGSNETTEITLTWALSLLLNSRNVLQKAQEELDIHVGKHQQVEHTHIKDLVYLQAIVKETLRLYPPTPLSVPREAMEDCIVAGYHIPAGTRLILNQWKLHRDPTIWKNPSEFQPERFLNEHASFDARGQDFEYLPFGSGRRMCPGVSFAFQLLHLSLARLLHGFEFGTVSDNPVDMNENPGLTIPKAEPLEVVIKPRLPAMLYDC